MTQRSRLPRLGLALCVLVAAACGGPARPDLVLVTFDTLRLDHVGAQPGRPGGSLTPNLDALGRDARVFERAFTTMPTTAPAHASLFTGLAPREHGIQRNGDRIRPELVERGLPRRLQEGGYATGAFVTSHVFGDAMGLGGFDRWDVSSEPLRPGSDAATAALAWLDEAPRPFFLWLHLYDPHSPYGPAARKADHYPIDQSRYGWVDPALYADPRARHRQADLYAQGVREADQALGLLLRGLERRGLQPFVAVTADHGELLDEQLAATGFAYGHGALLTEEVLRVPLVLAGPGVAPGRVASAVSLRDLYTTLLAVAGLPDDEASLGGRADLRGAVPADRHVAAARRVFARKDRAKRGMDEAALASVREHTVAVADASHLLVLGDDGEPAAGSPEEAPALLEAARHALGEEIAARAARSDTPLDPDTRRSLEALGYLE